MHVKLKMLSSTTVCFALLLLLFLVIAVETQTVGDIGGSDKIVLSNDTIVKTIKANHPTQIEI